MSAPRAQQRSRGGARGGSRNAAQTRISSDTESTKAISRNPRSGLSNRSLKLGESKNGVRTEANAKTKKAPVKKGVSSASNQQWRITGNKGTEEYKMGMQELWQKLKISRDKERKDAIRNGLLADPDKPTRLKDAITPVGTCQDMCPQYERVERIVQQMVDGCEKAPAPGSNTKLPSEALMVKRFRRSAAGYDEQLPSDIRPPLVLQKTLNYLMDEVVGGPEPLAKVHKFVWDRTRGIRNDFSIQQVTKLEDLKVAIDCFERIARFHLLSLHQLSHPDRDNGEFDHHQEREQLNNTLLSLIYYYEDSRKRLQSPNEAEFRAYCIIFEIQDQRPDLEDRAQMWPQWLVLDPRVQTALRIYAAAMDTTNEHGPLRPRATFSIAQAASARFWTTVWSKQVSYLMACAAEIYFNLVRGNALEEILSAWKRAGRKANTEDLILSDLRPMLGFDNVDQTQKYCKDHGFSTNQREKDGLISINLRSLNGNPPIDSDPRRKQVFSKSLVEKKRRGRTFQDVINGLSFAHCREAGLLVEDESCGETSEEEPSLFVPSSEDETSTNEKPASKPVLANGFAKPTATASNPFVLETTQSNPFAKPSGSLNSTSPSIFGQSARLSTTSQSASSFGFGQSPSTGSSNVSAPQFQSPDTTSPSFIFGTNTASSPFQKPPISNTAIADKLFKSSSTQALNAGFVPTTTTAPINATTFPSSNSIPSFSQNAFPTAKSSGSDNVNANEFFGSKTNQIDQLFPSTSQSNSGVFGKPAPATPSAPSLFTFNAPPDLNTITGSPFPSSASAQVAGHQQDRESAAFASGTESITKSNSLLSQSGNVQKSSNVHPTAPVQPGSTSTLFQFKPNNASPMTSSTTFTPSTTTAARFGANDETSFSTNSLSKAEKLSSSKPLTTFGASQQPNVPFQPSINTSPQISTSSSIPTTSIPAKPLTSSSLQPQPPTPSSITKPISAKNPLGHVLRNLGSPLSTPTSSPITTSPGINSSSPSREAKERAEVRSKALDDLSTEVVCGEYGLLEMIIEHVAAPLVHKSLRKVATERERERVAAARTTLLGIKYFRRWRDNAWKLSLMRRGEERRKNFAQSIRSLTQSARNSRSNSIVSSQEGTQLRPLASLLAFPNHASMPSMAPPPPRSSSNQQKGISLPMTMSGEGQNGVIKLPNRDHSLSKSSMLNRKPQSPHHKRAQTVNGSINMMQSGRITKRPNYLSRTGRHFVGADEFMSDSLMKQARLLISGRTDKTRTDYFRLKAMGVDPDTPVVPQGRKRIRVLDASDHESSKSPRISPPEPSLSPRPRSIAPESPNRSSINSHAPSYDADEEELFAQVRQIREAMAEGEAWFRQEREKEEKKRASDEPRPETEKEKRLREFQFTPSRTSIRLQRTNASGLLPEGWANKPEKGKEKEEINSSMTESQSNSGSTNLYHSQKSQPTGFAALSNSNNGGSGLTSGGFGAFTPTRSSNGFGFANTGTGASADDAIEL